MKKHNRCCGRAAPLRLASLALLVGEADAFLVAKVARALLSRHSAFLGTEARSGTTASGAGALRGLDPLTDAEAESEAVDGDDASALDGGAGARAEEPAKDMDEESRWADYRPHAQAGVPEAIEFGIYVKSIGGINLLTGGYFADLVLTLRWSDPRAGKLPSGLGAESVTLSQKAANKRLWMPDVKISNRDVKGVDVISTAVTVDTSGNVTKVQRALARLQTTFSVNAFPFDTQDLPIRLASTSLMTDELVFLPSNDSNLTGISNSSLDDADFYLVDSWSHAIEEVDSTLRKSRGEFTVRLRRMSSPYFQSLLLPELMVLGISLSVFWFPLTGPFAMPRVGTALISFLALTTLGLRTNSMVPTRGGLAWIDLFETCCQSIILFTLVMNIVVLVVFHSYEELVLADRIDKELRVNTPMVAMPIFCACFYKTDGTNLWFLNFVINNVLTLFGIVYILFCIWRLKKRKEQRRLEADKEEARILREQQEALKAMEADAESKAIEPAMSGMSEDSPKLSGRSGASAVGVVHHHHHHHHGLLHGHPRLLRPGVVAFQETAQPGLGQAAGAAGAAGAASAAGAAAASSKPHRPTSTSSVSSASSASSSEQDFS